MDRIKGVKKNKKTVWLVPKCIFVNVVIMTHTPNFQILLKRKIQIRLGLKLNRQETQFGIVELCNEYLPQNNFGAEQMNAEIYVKNHSIFVVYFVKQSSQFSIVSCI